jgi:RNA polymerase sigma factor (sigma-70 family)
VTPIDLQDCLEANRTRWMKWAARAMPRQDAEDIVQDAAVHALKGLPHFKGECSLSTWMDRIVRNLILDYLRRFRNRHHEPLWDDNHFAPRYQEEASTFAVLWGEVRRFLALLSIAERESILVMYRGESSSNLVKTRRHRSMEKLRRVMEIG